MAIGQEFKQAFHEIPAWGWWMVAAGAIILVIFQGRKKSGGAVPDPAAVQGSAGPFSQYGASDVAYYMPQALNILGQEDMAAQDRFTQLQAQISTENDRIAELLSLVAGLQLGGSTNPPVQVPPVAPREDGGPSGNGGGQTPGGTTGGNGGVGDVVTLPDPNPGAVFGGTPGITAPPAPPPVPVWNGTPGYWMGGTWMYPTDAMGNVLNVGPDGLGDWQARSSTYVPPLPNNTSFNPVGTPNNGTLGPSGTPSVGGEPPLTHDVNLDQFAVPFGTSAGAGGAGISKAGMQQQ